MRSPRLLWSRLVDEQLRPVSSGSRVILSEYESRRSHGRVYETDEAPARATADSSYSTEVTTSSSLDGKDP